MVAAGHANRGGVVTQDQREFFEVFGIAPPPGMSVEGTQRFVEAYLRDPARQARWQAHLSRRGAAPAPQAAAVPAPTPAPARVAPTVAAPRVAGAASPPEPFRFIGSGGEYFGIWIVNLLLTLVTLGIYSAWAKVRRLQYFYRHTQVAGASFDYHGTGGAILKGRIIALGLFLAYNYSFQFSATLGVITLVLLAVVLPWLLRNSFRFRMRYSSYRGLRFRFTGSNPGAYATFLLRPIIVLFTLYLAAPWFHQRLKQYQHGNAHYGQAPFAFTASAGQFYKEYLLIGLLALVLLAVPLGMVFSGIAEVSRAAQESGGQPDPRLLIGTMVTAFIAMMLASLAIAPIFQARLQNLVWNHTTLGPHRFQSTVSAWRLFLIHLTNLLGVIVTFGLFMPWAAVRVARYRVESVTLLPEGNLDEFVAQQEQDLGAAGEEAAEMFDIDIAL